MVAYCNGEPEKRHSSTGRQRDSRNSDQWEETSFGAPWNRYILEPHLQYYGHVCLFLFRTLFYKFHNVCFDDMVKKDGDFTYTRHSVSLTLNFLRVWSRETLDFLWCKSYLCLKVSTPLQHGICYPFFLMWINIRKSFAGLKRYCLFPDLAKIQGVCENIPFPHQVVRRKESPLTKWVFHHSGYGQ